MFPFSFWQIPGIEPITLGQPSLYVVGFDNNFLNATVPSDATNIDTMRRYNDDAYTYTAVNTTSRAAYRTGSALGLNHGTISWTGNVATNGTYSGGTDTDFSFMHQLGNCQFTMYLVYRNVVNENTGTTKVLFTTSQSTGNRGVILTQNGSANPGIRRFSLSIRNNTAGQNVTSMLWPTFNNTDQIFDVYSARVSQPASIGDTMQYGYVNGLEVATSTYDNVLASQADSFSNMRIGNRLVQDLRFNGRVGELIIFNTMHDEVTHKKVVNYLRTKWSI